ncbi:MAG: MFS transporter [Acetobacterium sp.]|uniref:MFS transporter n=1 Tax=Acetobacterium sp. TaxID=1872094 RepID=UPI003242E5E5
MKTKDTKKIKLAILSIASLLMISMTASAILADIELHFPDLEESVVQMVLTLPALLGLIFAFVAGPLSMRISKKSLVIFSLINGLIGGLIALILGPLAIGFLLLASVLIGIAQGINATMTLALITDYFTGEESGAMMGLQSAFLNGGSMVLLFTSGLLANIKWNHAYLVYLAFLPVLFIVIKNLPHDRPGRADLTKNSEGAGKLNVSVYFIAAFIFLFGSFFFVFQTNIALLVVSKGYGDATLSGMINTAVSASGMVTGIKYGNLKRRLKMLAIPIGIGAVGMGLGLIYVSGTLASIFVAAILVGFGIGIVMPTGIFMAANAVKNGMQSTAIALVTAAVNLGMFVSPLLFNMVSLPTASESLSTKFIVSSICLLLLAVLFAIGQRFILQKRNCED